MSLNLEYGFVVPSNESITICDIFPDKVVSSGIWRNLRFPEAFLTYRLPQLELQVLIILGISHLLNYILKDMGVPFLASQILTGLVLGPTMLGGVSVLRNHIFPYGSGTDSIHLAAAFGMILFIFLMGVKTDATMVVRSGKRAIAIGLCSSFFPSFFGFMYYISVTRSMSSTQEFSRMSKLLVVVGESLTPFAVIAHLLSELKMLNSAIGRLALSCAMVGHLIDIAVLYFFYFYINQKMGHGIAVLDGAAIALFGLIVFFVVRPVLQWMIRRTPDGEPLSDVYGFATIILAFASGYYPYHFNYPPLAGAFLFGLAVPDGPPLGSFLVDKLESFVTGILLPLYVATTAMRTNLRTLFIPNEDVRFVGCVVCLNFVIKVAAPFIAGLLFSMPWNHSLALALILSSKGVVEIGTFMIAKSQLMILDATYTAVMIGVLLNAAFIPIIVRALYDSISNKYQDYQQRDLLHLNPDSALKLLLCVHDADDVGLLVKLLETTYPTNQAPTELYVLHLMELMGRTSPIFISHQQQKQHRLMVRLSFENVILAFSHYGNQLDGAVTVSSYTAISNPDYMHEDICMLALEKQTCFVLLPFHRRCTFDGTVENGSGFRRNLNCFVLDKAPCSVGILIPSPAMARGTIKRNNIVIGVLFFGGNDDREALTLARRMAKNPNVRLTVIRFIADGSGAAEMDWECVLDTELLKDVKRAADIDGDTLYMEKVVKDGPETALIVRKLADEYDLMIIGKRYEVECVQTTGLSQWSEFPELGVVGDLLASTDLSSRVATLIVQQAQIKM